MSNFSLFVYAIVYGAVFSIRPYPRYLNINDIVELLYLKADIDREWFGKRLSPEEESHGQE